MIEPEGNKPTRPAADLQKQADFKELVLWAYSKRGSLKAQYAYQLARNSANQRGRELKADLPHASENATTSSSRREREQPLLISFCSSQMSDPPTETCIFSPSVGVALGFWLTAVLNLLCIVYS